MEKIEGSHTKTTIKQSQEIRADTKRQQKHRAAASHRNDEWLYLRSYGRRSFLIKEFNSIGLIKTTDRKDQKSPSALSFCR